MIINFIDSIVIKLDPYVVLDGGVIKLKWDRDCSDYYIWGPIEVPNCCDRRDEWTCAHAAEGGYLEILKWARANGCPWNEKTRIYAAMNGHVETLIWAVENGCLCHCGSNTLQCKYCYPKILQWAKKNDAI
jgi:hypothetical protein